MAVDLGDINPDDSAPDYERFIIAPKPGGGLAWAKAGYDSIRGRIASEWRIENDFLNLDIIVPPNCSATVLLPTSAPESITETGKETNPAEGVERLGLEEGSVAFRVNSGAYCFRTPWRKTTR